MKRLLLLLLLVPTMALAWEPTRPVTVVIGNAPGAGNEIAFRKLSQIINRTNKKITFVVENRAGGDSVIAMNHMMTVAPDGHTIAAFNHMSQYVTQDIWQRDIKRYEYNSFEDVLTIGKSPLVLVAISTSAVNTPDEFATRVAHHTASGVCCSGVGRTQNHLRILDDENCGQSQPGKTCAIQRSCTGPKQCGQHSRRHRVWYHALGHSSSAD
jgi:tripartite-type tricarboxylate transporter receptor subunit TctC